MGGDRTGRVRRTVAREEARWEREPITDANREAAMSGPELSESVHEETLYEEQVTTDKQTVPMERVRLEKGNSGRPGAHLRGGPQRAHRSGRPRPAELKGMPVPELAAEHRWQG